MRQHRYEATHDGYDGPESPSWMMRDGFGETQLEALRACLDDIAQVEEQRQAWEDEDVPVTVSGETLKLTFDHEPEGSEIPI